MVINHSQMVGLLLFFPHYWLWLWQTDHLTSHDDAWWPHDSRLGETGFVDEMCLSWAIHRFNGVLCENMIVMFICEHIYIYIIFYINIFINFYVNIRGFCDCLWTTVDNVWKIKGFIKVCPIKQYQTYLL